MQRTWGNIALDPLDPPKLTTSERHAFKRCPQRWWWEYNDGLRTTEIGKALWFGIGVHLALARYYGNVGYKRNMDYVDLWRDYCDNDEISKVLKAAPDGFSEDETWIDAKKLGEEMLTGYHKLYRGDPDWDVVHVEMPFEIGIPDPRDPAADVVIFNSTFDGVYRSKSRKKFRLMEHKTAKAIQTQHLPLDDQGGSYWAVASSVLREKGILAKGQSVDGIEYNFLRKGLPDERPKDSAGYSTNKPQKKHYVEALIASGRWHSTSRDALEKWSLPSLVEEVTNAGIRVVGERSSQQPPALFERVSVNRTKSEQRMMINRIAAEGLMMAQFRSGALPLYKNPTRDCHWDCSFFNMCQLHEQGTDWEEFRNSVFLVRDPYDRYRTLKSA